MKPTGQIDFAFDTGLVVCLRDDVEDGELQVSFEESLSLQLAAGWVHSLLLLASQIEKEHSIEDLLNFLIVFLISLLLKPNFLQQHKADLEQYPLAPTSTIQSCTFFSVPFKNSSGWMLSLWEILFVKLLMSGKVNWLCFNSTIILLISQLVSFTDNQ